MPEYNYITLSSFVDQLASALGDTTKSFYTEEELATYTKEALITWGCASLYYRNRDQFLTMNGESFYDLAAELPKLVMTTRDRELAQQLMYSLIEPQIVDWLNWQGTEQFSLDIIREAMQRACNQFLLETGMYMYVRELVVPLAPISKVPLLDEVLDVRRVTSTGVDGKIRILSREDPFILQAYSIDWSNNPKSKPDFWTVATEPLLTIQLAPIANDIAKLHALIIPHGNTLDFEVGQILGIPEAFIWVVKYLTLLELLGGSDMQAADPIRAKYCEMRVKEGIQLAKLYPSILDAYINGRQANIISLSDKDSYDWNWQNQSGVPKQVAVASWNLIALSPVPSSSDVSILVDYVCNPTLPLASGSFLQIDKSLVAMLLDYCRHLALFKVGGAEFLASRQGYDRMMQAAALHNGRLQAQAFMFSSLYDNVSNEKMQRKFAQEQEEADNDRERVA
jgi:hypothetical protein